MENKALLLKALSDPNRLLIIETLAKSEHCDCDKNCGCRLLENLKISQPTLSHHMRILCECGLTLPRKDGKRTFYTLDHAVIEELFNFLGDITTPGDFCPCKGNL